MSIVERSLLSRRNLYLFVNYPWLLRLWAKRSCMTILLTILTGQDQRSALSLSSERADISIMIRISTTETICWRSVLIPWLSQLTRSGCDRRYRNIHPHGLLDCLPPSVRWVHLVHGSHHFLLFFFRYGVVHLLFRVYVMDPSLRRHIAFAGKMSCVSASRAPHVCSTGRNGLPWLPVIRQVDLDSLQRLLEILEHLF